MPAIVHYYEGHGSGECHSRKSKGENAVKKANNLPNGNKNSIIHFGGWGWLTIVFCLLMFWFYVGMVNDGTNYLAPAVAANLGVEKSVILACNSAAGLVGVLFYIVLGQVNKRIGPSITAGLTTIASAVAYWAAGNATSVAMYLISMCFVVGSIMTAGYIAGGTLVAQWFPKKKGVVMGYTTMGHNLASAFYVPLVMVLFGTLGVRMGVFPICIATAILGVFILIFQRDLPFQRGLNPDNVSDHVYQTEYDTGEGDADGNGGWTVGKLLKTKELWLAAITTGGFQICSVGVMQQLVSRNVELGFAEGTAVSIMTVLALGGVVGSWLIGIIDDRLGTKRTMMGFGVWYATALLLNFTNNMSLVYVSLFMIAMGIGGSANFTTSLPASIFGRQGFDLVNSVCFPIQGAVTALCFLVNSLVLNVTGGNLRYAYLVFAGVALVMSGVVATVDEHKYNRDWKVAHSGQPQVAEKKQSHSWKPAEDGAGK